MKANSAIESFNENLKIIDDPNSNSEKYFLYQGLISMAAALVDLQDDIKILKRNLAQVQTITKRKSFATGRWKR
ncbi:hypothetical protein ACFL3R_00360 [Thermodesulfobacteriota bacterium]